MYSDQGDEKVIECDSIDEFMNVLEFVNATVPDEMLVYSDPMIPMTYAEVSPLLGLSPKGKGLLCL